jgi:flagellar basal body-associated protein FliL
MAKQNYDYDPTKQESSLKWLLLAIAMVIVVVLLVAIFG